MNQKVLVNLVGVLFTSSEVMKSGKQRRLEIMEKRRGRVLIRDFVNTSALQAPFGAVLADREILRKNNPFGVLPLFYADHAFNCRECGCAQIWTAKQQRWWYELMLADISSVEIRCRPCRKKEQERKQIAREIHLKGLAAKNKH